MFPVRSWTFLKNRKLKKITNKLCGNFQKYQTLGGQLNLVFWSSRDPREAYAGWRFLIFQKKLKLMHPNVQYTWLVWICLALPIKDYPEAGEMVADTGHCLTILGMTSILASCEIPSRILFIPVGADRIREQKSTAFHLSLKCIFTIRY